MLEDTKWHSAIKVLRDGMAVLGPLTPVPWLMILGSDMAMGSSGNLKTMVSLRLIPLPSCTGTGMIALEARDFGLSYRLDILSHDR